MFQQYFPADLNDIIFSRQRLRRLEGRVSLPAAVDNQWYTVAQLVLPKTDHGYITAYSAEVIDPSWDYNGSIRFRLLVGSSPVDDCDAWSEFRGSIPQPADALFFVPPGQTITAQVIRAVAGTDARDIVMGAVIQTWPQIVASPWPVQGTHKRPDDGSQRRTLTPR